MRIRVMALLLPLVGMAVGCGRVATMTTIAADGSATRVVTVKAPLKNPMGQEEKEITPENLLKIPAASAKIKVAKSTEEELSVIRVTRAVPAGSEPVQDVTLMDPKKKTPVATSRFQIKKLPNGNLEYTEVIKWLGKKVPLIESEDLAESRAQIKAALPERFRKTEILDMLAIQTSSRMVQMLFGPPEPTLVHFFADPELAERKFMISIYGILSDVIKSTAPDITPAELKQTMRSLLDSMEKSKTIKKVSAKSSPSDPEKAEQSSGDMTTLFFEISVPGTLVSSNGIYDPVKDRVFWSLYPSAASLGDVTLRAEIKP